MQNNSNIIILSADKESCTVILNRTDCIKKVNATIDDGVSQGEYVATVDNTHQYLEHFRNFLYRHFYKTKYYDKMRPISNQSASFFTTAKAHKFNKIENVNIKDFNYFKSLAKNNFIISDTLPFPAMLKKAVNSEHYEYVFYVVESHFANMPAKETIEYIVYKI